MSRSIDRISHDVENLKIKIFPPTVDINESITTLYLHLVDSTIKKPLERINDVLILANRNYVPIDFIVLDIDCNPSCPIILGRPYYQCRD